MSAIQKIRNGVLEQANRSPAGRRASAQASATYFRRRGAHPGLLDEALKGAGKRTATRTAEMIMWAGAVGGVCRFPEYFPATTYIKDPDNKEASADALEKYFVEHPDAAPELRRFYLTFRPGAADVTTRDFIDADLRRRLHERATRRPASMKADRFTQISILRDAVCTLEAASLKPFLVSGTLLGLVRDGQIMEHDYDIDLGLLPGEGDAQRVVDAMAGNPWFEIDVQEWKIVLRHKSGFVVDVFIHYERDGLVWHGSEIHEWWNTPFELVRSKLHDVPVWVPDDHDTYLRENYGDWSKPVAFYDFSFDTPNRVYRKSGEALVYLYRRCLKGVKNNDRWSAESAARELRDSFGIDITEEMQASGLLRPGCPVSHES